MSAATELTVGLEVTPGVLIRTGVGRYPVALAPALEELDWLQVRRLAAIDRPAMGTAMRLVQAVRREGFYYPLALERRARKADAELLHLTHPAPTWTRRLPLAVTVHDLLPLRFPRLFPRATVAHTRISARALASADRVLTNSEHTRAEVIELLDLAPERVVATPFGVDQRFRPAPVDRDWLSERFDIRGPYVLAVGTLEPRKNLEGVLRAYDLLERDFPDHACVVVGGKGWRDRTLGTALSRPRERLVATGFVEDEDLVRLYSGADCFVFPSFAEGFGLPVLEAMACGAPVVTSDRSSLPEVAGDAAILVDPDEPEAIAAGIRRVLASPERAARLRARGLERAAGFSWRACAERTAAVYRELVAAAGRT
jgi:glycosyltransferase involved in cell wall biosynthesis